MGNVFRDWTPFTNVAVGTTLAECTALDMTWVSKFAIHILTGSAINQYEIWGADSENGEYGKLYDEENPPAALARVGLIATSIYPVSEASFPLGFVKIIANAAGTVTVYAKG